MLSPYELPQIVAQIPPPPMNVPMPIQKALAIEGENRTIHYLLCGECELNHTSWSSLQQKYNVFRDTMYTALKEKEDQEVHSTNRKGDNYLNKKL